MNLQNMTSMNVFDLDGTLRDVTKSNFLAPRGNASRINKNWHNWQRDANEHGLPIEQGIALFNSAYQPIILTSSQFGTADWCKKHSLVPYGVIERQADDELSPFEYKKAFIDEFAQQINLWVDDNAQVCRYAMSQGIKVVKIAAPKGKQSCQLI